MTTALMFSSTFECRRRRWCEEQIYSYYTPYKRGGGNLKINVVFQIRLLLINEIGVFGIYYTKYLQYKNRNYINEKLWKYALN